MTSPDVPGSERPAGHAAVSRRSFRPQLPRLPSRSSLALRNWPVSRRLVAVIVMAVVMGLVFGGLRVASAIGTASSFARTTQLAVLGEQVTALAQAMETERDMSAAVLADDRVIAAATAAKEPDAVLKGLKEGAAPDMAAQASAQAATNAAATRTLNLTEQIGAQFPATTQARAATVVSQIGLIPALRSQLTGQTPLAAIQAYSEATADLFNLNDEITSGSGDPALSDEVRTLGAISRAKDQASQQRAILYAALIESAANDPAALADAGGLQALTTAAGLEQADLMAFQASATPVEQDAFLSTVASPEVDTAQLLGNFISQAQNLQDVKNLSPKGSAVITPATAPDLWYHAMTDTINRMRTIELQVAGRIVARSTMLQQGARESATLAGAVTAGVLLLVLIATLIVARSLVEPLRRLQADALEVASVRLPSRVAELGQSAEPDVSRGVEPIGVDSTDEIGRVARAFDQVHQEAVRLAGNEALLRGNVSAMFISLSRRSVPLIDRLTRMIDELEQNEDDPDRLSSLFAMDHLVTRMRRNSENLLVLAGEEPVRKWSEPVPLADVARAATSEIEQYGRIVLNIQPGIVVSGQAAADVVHLLAEIIENATMFSPRDTPVQLTWPGSVHRRGTARGRGRRDRHPADPARRDELAVRQPAARRRVGVQAHGAVRGIPAGGAARGASPAAGGGAAGRVRPGLAARQPHRPGVAPVHRPAVAAAREGVVHRAGAWRPAARGPGRRRPAAARTGHGRAGHGRRTAGRRAADGRGGQRKVGLVPRQAAVRQR